MQRTSLLAAALLLFAACGSPRGSGDTGASGDPGPAGGMGPAPESGRPADASAPLGPAAEPVAARWTDQFSQKAIVVAQEIRIEAPAGLINHLAVRSDDSLFDRVVETTEDGLRMVWTPKVAGELIRGQLDNWSLTAFGRIVAVEKPWSEEVTVTALGEAFWQDVDGQEDRADRLEWRGELE